MKPLLLFLAWLPLAAAAEAPGRWIVELADEPVAGHVLRTAGRGRARAALASEQARNHRARLRAEQRRVGRGVEAEGAAVVDQVDTVANALLVRAGDAAAARLERLPGVRRVVPARRFRLMLDRALPLHKVPEAWERVGAEQAGQGIKIGIIDTGIDASHPGFQDPTMSAPEGYPRFNDEADAAFTNGKIIVARSYAAMFDREDDPTARDNVGHGTATAMAAAGVRNGGPLAFITGVAPKAWIGSYKVFGTPGVNENPSDDIIIKALDDAVADGMDVVNLSLGSALAPSVRNDPLVQAVERASEVGVVVVISAGNTGPDANTVASPATAPSAISVGASVNDRLFSTNVAIAGGRQYLSIPGTGPSPATPLTGPVKDVAAVDVTGLACNALPNGSLEGQIALILRGECFFEVKLLNAEAAGAIGAIVYTDRGRPEAIGMEVGPARLPAQMVSYADGAAIKDLLAEPVEATLHFTLAPVWVDPQNIAGFSARGPSVDNGVKPDLLATGTYVYTAALRSFGAEIFSRDGYTDVNGTSFSAPLVAGAAGLLKAARPGLTAAQYRSLLVNSAAPAYSRPGESARAQEGGAGVLDVGAALRSTIAAAPVSLSFGVGGPDGYIPRVLTLTNIGTAPETYLLTAIPRDGAPVPELPASTLELQPGETAEFQVAFPASGLQTGQYEGVIAVEGTVSGVQSRIPYWYAVGSPEPRAISLIYTTGAPDAGSTVSTAIAFRILNAAGVAINAIDPTVTVVSGGAEVTRIRPPNAFYPGVFFVGVRFGVTPSANVFRIQAGDLTREVRIATGR